MPFIWLQQSFARTKYTLSMARAKRLYIVAIMPSAGNVLQPLLSGPFIRVAS